MTVRPTSTSALDNITDPKIFETEQWTFNDKQ